MREIEFKSSRLLGLLLTGVAALALGAVWLAAMPAGGRLFFALAVAGLAIWGWRRTRSPVRMRLTAAGQLQARDDAGEWRDAEVRGDSFVSTALIVLRYRIGDAPVRSLTLLPDSADADDLRRLRVSLRWARRTRSDTASRDAG